jgi:putative intracellular protease/amidase
MFDLATSSSTHALINEFYAANKVVSAVCHGPAALVHVRLPDGKYLVQDQPVTGFSNAEEEQVGLAQAMPFLLEDALTENGAKYEKAAEPWGEKVSIGRGGRLITGQNPASAAAVGEAIKKAVGA